MRYTLQDNTFSVSLQNDRTYEQLFKFFNDFQCLAEVLTYQTQMYESERFTFQMFSNDILRLYHVHEHSKKVKLHPLLLLFAPTFRKCVLNRNSGNCPFVM